MVRGECQKSIKKIKFGSINQAGFLTGGGGEAGVVQSINGLIKDKWFGGIGLGLDFYRQRTVPLFLDIRKDFSNRKNTPFAYADGGINFRWLNDDQTQRFNVLSYKTPPGFCYDFGIGCKLQSKNNKGFIFSAGYSFKQMTETIKLRWGAPTPELQQQDTERYNYLYKRVVVKFGVML